MFKTLKSTALFFSLSIFTLYVKPAVSDTISLLNWNVNAGTVENIAARRGGIEKLASEVTPDILVVQEVNSFAAVQLISKYLGMEDPYIAVSNFGKDSEIVYKGLEVAVASRFPIRSVTEYQNEWSNTGQVVPDTNPPFMVKNGEVELLGSDSIQPLIVPNDIITDPEKLKQPISRGLLRVALEKDDEEIIVVYPIHLKSNRTRLCGIKDEIQDVLWTVKKSKDALPSVESRLNDLDTAVRWSVRSTVHGKPNPASISSVKFQRESEAFLNSHRLVAIQRENAVAAVAKLVNDDLSHDQVKAVIVAGDFNTPLNEPSKTGADLNEDSCLPAKLDCNTKLVKDTCGDMDGYDDTHHILRGGIVNGLKMIPLFDKEEATYNSEDYAQSPIDNIYVVGKIAGGFQDARLLKGSGEVAFGSDHFPILTEFEW